VLCFIIAIIATAQYSSVASVQTSCQQYKIKECVKGMHPAKKGAEKSHDGRPKIHYRRQNSFFGTRQRNKRATIRLVLKSQQQMNTSMIALYKHCTPL
jgi:hypothetical protein